MEVLYNNRSAIEVILLLLLFIREICICNSNLNIQMRSFNKNISDQPNTGPLLPPYCHHITR